MHSPWCLTRRQVLQSGAATITATLLGASPAAAEKASWESVTSPVDVTLWDVETTARNDFAVGGSGIVVERADEGWTKVVDGGPTGNGNDLYGGDVTDDGERLWFVGASGAIGEYDVETGLLVDHSAPNDVTNNFNDVAVTGGATEANVYVAGDSGKIYYSFENGKTGSWNSVTPGSGSAINAIDFYDAKKGHAVDGNTTVFVTDDGTTWDKRGIENADQTFYGVDSDGEDTIWVAAGGGTVYHWNGTEWTTTNIGEPDVVDLELADGTGYAVGNSGAIFDRENGSWTRDETPSGQNLKAIIDEEANNIATGAAGTIYETDPDASAEPASTDDEAGDAGRLDRVSTQTSESKTLTFRVENTGDQAVTLTEWAMATNVQVESIQRAGAEVTLSATAIAGSSDGFLLDGALRSMDDAPTIAAGETGGIDFGQYDNGNVALTIEPTAEKPIGDYVGVSLGYDDGTAETFYFEVTNVNS